MHAEIIHSELKYRNQIQIQHKYQLQFKVRSLVGGEGGGGGSKPLHRQKRHRLVAKCQFYQHDQNLTISSIHNKSVKIRRVTTCSKPVDNKF